MIYRDGYAITVTLPISEEGQLHIDVDEGVGRVFFVSESHQEWFLDLPG
jgi:hypothetical protein